MRAQTIDVGAVIDLVQPARRLFRRHRSRRAQRLSRLRQSPGRRLRLAPRTPPSRRPRPAVWPTPSRAPRPRRSLPGSHSVPSGRGGSRRASGHSRRCCTP